MADRKGLSVSVALGTLLIPLTAFAASVLVGDGMAAEPVTTVGSAVFATQADPGSDGQAATAADLVAACGRAGLDLVDGEANGSITELQQSALDALREICAQQGMPLPGKPVPEPIVQSVVSASSAPPVTQGSFEDESEHEEHEDDDDEHEEYEEDDD
ncbi:MAG: hypothetical protein WD473_02990 [Acidimicrobiia bacterium]